MILLAIPRLRSITSGFSKKSHKSKLLELAKKISGFVPAYLSLILKPFYSIAQKCTVTNLRIFVYIYSSIRGEKIYSFTIVLFIIPCSVSIWKNRMPLENLETSTVSE